MPSANGHGKGCQDRYPLGRHRARGTERVPVAASPVRRTGLGPVPSSVSLFTQGVPAAFPGLTGSVQEALDTLSPLIPQLSPGRHSSGLAALPWPLASWEGHRVHC